MALKKGDTARVHYEGRLDDGYVFDKSEENTPLELVIGEGNFIQKFEESLIGKSSGDTFEVVIHPEDAYGERDKELIVSIDRDIFGEEVLRPGTPVTLETEDGPLEVFIVEVNDSEVVVDGNHPLSGEVLTLKVTVL